MAHIPRPSSLPSPTVPEVESPPKAVLIALYAAVLTAALDIAMVIPAIPVIGESFELDARWVAWVYAVFTLSNLAGVPAMSWLADTFDRRTVLMCDLGLFALGAAVVCLSSTFPQLLVGRGLQGLAAAGIFPIVSSVIGDSFPDRLRGRALGIMGSVFGIAFIIGPPASGLLLLVEWRLIFLVSVPLGAIALLLVYRHVPVRAARHDRISFDAAGLAVLVSMVFLGAYALNSLDADAHDVSLRSVHVVLPTLAIALLVPLFLYVERRAERPVVRLALFENTDVRVVVIVAIGAGFCEAAMVFTPYFASEAFGVDRATASYMFIPLALAVAFGSPVFGRMIDRVGVRSVVAAACGCLLVGLFGLSFSASVPAVFYPSSVAVGLGLAGLLGSALNYIMLGAAKSFERATTQGFVTLSLNMGLSLGAAVVGAVVASSATAITGFRTAFLGLSILAGALLLLSFRLRVQDPTART